MNVYLDSSHSVIKYLKDMELNIRNLLIMTGDFNIRNSLWDPSYNFHSSISNDLFVIADSSNLFLSFPIDQIPTRYADNANNLNSVLDLMFLWCDSKEINSHIIHPDWQLTSDHVPLTISIPIVKEYITTHKRTLIKNSVEEVEFINEVIALFSKVNALSISNISDLDEIVSNWADIVDRSWSKHSKLINITKCSKSWWNDKYSQDLANYRFTKSIKSWKMFWKTVKYSKREFFNLKIQEIANKRRGPWELMNWINKKKLPAIEIIKHNSSSCLELNDLWQALHLSFNSAQLWSVDESILNKCELFLPMTWLKFSEEEFTRAITNCKDSSVPGLDKMFWGHLKRIIKDKSCLKNVICIANACFDIGHWPNHFKKSTTIVIPKPNKSFYDFLKSFRSIILLNTLGKIIEKVIGERLQFQVILNNFIHQSQLGRLKFKSTTDTGIALTHFICTRWIKNLSTSSLVFDIAQFFPSLNHCLLSLILDKAGFSSQVVNFFSKYLINRKTSYYWNNFSSHSFDVNVGVG